MRISDLGIFNRYLRYDKIQQEKIERYSNELSSGKKILSPSDSTIDNARTMRLKSINSEIDSFLRNMDFVQTTQNVAEQTFDNILNISSEAKIDILQLFNTGVLDEEDAQIYKEYLTDIRDYIVNQANTKIGDNYIFGGIKSQTPPFDANGYYDGDTKDTKAPIAAGTDVPIKFIGSDTFSTEKSKKTTIPSSTINEIEDTGSYQLETNIEPKTIQITKIGSSTVNYKDDGEGNIIDVNNNNNIVGSIDYTKGLITINSEKNSGNSNAIEVNNYNVYQQKIGIVKTIDDITSIIENGNLSYLHGKISQFGFDSTTDTLEIENSSLELTENSTDNGTYKVTNDSEQLPLQKKSIFIQSNNGSDVNWVDDGKGNIIDLNNNNDIVGSIDYDTGIITITSHSGNSSNDTITLNQNVIVLQDGEDIVSIAYDNDTTDNRYPSTLAEIINQINTNPDNIKDGNIIFEAFTFTDKDGQIRLGILNKKEGITNVNISINGDLTIRTGSMDYLINNYDKHFNNIERERSKLGTQMKLLQNLKDQHENFKVNYSELISKLEDSDISKAIIELEKAKTAYEATMASFMQNRNLTLLNHFKR